MTLVLSKSKPQNGRVYVYNTCCFQELKENIQGTSATPSEHFTLCACQCACMFVKTFLQDVIPA